VKYPDLFCSLLAGQRSAAIEVKVICTQQDVARHVLKISSPEIFTFFRSFLAPFVIGKFRSHLIFVPYTRFQSGSEL